MPRSLHRPAQRAPAPARFFESLESRVLMSVASSDPASDPAPAPPTDTQPPTVDAVFVNGTDWSQSFRDYLQAKKLGSAQFGFETDPVNASANGAGPGTNDLKHAILPWINLNQISIRFSEDVSVQQNDLTISSAAGQTYNVTDFRYDPATFTATWTLDRSIGADVVGLRLDGTSPTGVTDAAGNPLKGNVNDNGSTDSGDPGGATGVPQARDYVDLLPVLPGDVNRSGTVLANDFSLVKSKFFSSTAEPDEYQSRYSPFADVDGSGSILANDYSAVKSRFFTRLPDNPPDTSSPQG